MTDDPTRSAGAAARRRAAVTGASGYVGSRVADHLRRSGYAVCEWTRDPRRLGSGEPPPRAYALEAPLEARDLADVDVLVHCAWDFGPTRWERIREVNVAGSARLLCAAAEAGVAAVLISSMSGFPGCRSLYGRAKLEIEQEAARVGAAVVRPGLVFGAGAGGMVGRLARLVERLPAVPLVGGGRQVLHLAHAEDLSRLVRAAAERGVGACPRPLIAASETGRTLAEIVTVLAAARGRRARTFPVPWRAVHAGLALCERVGLRPGLRSDSVVSLVNQDPRPDFSAARELAVPFRPFDATTAAA